MSRSRNTLQKVFAILALVAILLGVVGTFWLNQMPTPSPVTVENIETVPASPEVLTTPAEVNL